MKLYSILLAVFSMLLAACGGGSSSTTNSTASSINHSVPATANVIPECELKPKIIIDPQAPQITLNGERIINLPLGSTYVDARAFAKDANNNDLTAEIQVTGLNKVDPVLAGDYLIRYDVSDSENKKAQSVHRIVRVFSDRPKKYSLRPFNSTSAPMGFLEHLPTYIAEDPDARYPLLLVAHGWEHFVQQSPANDRLLTLTYGANIYRVFDENLWPDSRPFIVLEPQRCLEVGDIEWQQVDQLIDWALATYPIDSSRIYLTGMSAGGYFTYRFPVLFPNRLAAIAPMSAGGPVSASYEIASFCKAMEHMPIWAFHGDTDRTVPLDHTTYTLNILNNECPTPPSPTPLLTVVPNGDHVISNRIWDDSFIGQGDAKYTVQNESLYDWFLRYSLPEKQ
ncbi:MAG: immunoglobulin-like domain-containing protein [Pseudomonadota bacterium]